MLGKQLPCEHRPHAIPRPERDRHDDQLRTQPDNVALDGAGRNSPFTTALLKHIATPGIDIGTIMRKVRADVRSMTHETQVPWDHSSLIGDAILAH